MAFTAMVGKELLMIDFDPDNPGKTILSTYVPTNCDDTVATSDSVATGEDDDDFQDALDEEEKEGVAEMKTTRPSMGGMLDDDSELPEHSKMNGTSIEKHDVVQNADIFQKQEQDNEGDRHPVAKNAVYQKPAKETSSKKETMGLDEPKRRFQDSMSALQIEEAKATGRAQLGLAFEMLTMMKKRALKADPEAYQCLIDACGRVGDTKRATDLLAKMHEDGIVADGTVYACLVSAFSAETAWKKGTKEEELPGMALNVFFLPNLDAMSHLILLCCF
jgi:pentatricopeptide repeat protein